MAHHVIFRDFMAGNFLAGDFLGGYHFRYIFSLLYLKYQEMALRPIAIVAETTYSEKNPT